MLKPLIPVSSLALVLLLSGCGDPTSVPSPPPTSSSSPVFASDEEALAAAEDAYAAYGALEDEIAQDGGANPQRLAPYVTPDWLVHEVQVFEDFRATGHKQVGSTSIGAVELQRSDSTEVAVYVCLDFSTTSFVDAQGQPVATSAARSATIEAAFEIADSGLILSGERTVVRINLLVVSVALLSLSLAIAGESGCSQFEINSGACPTVAGTIDDNTAVLNGTNTTPGTNGNPHTGANDGESENPSTPTPAPFRDPFIITQLPAVTLSDIAAFRPDAAVDHSEPSGWTVAGLDTNFYASGGSSTDDGMLLGLPASVRFTPVAWHWDYGDGTRASRSTGGASWSALGIPEFDPTATSHVYEQYGTYVIDLDVDYAAEYRFAGGPWLGITGVLSLPANRLTLTVGNATTVLVDRDCRQNSGGPGC